MYLVRSRSSWSGNRLSVRETIRKSRLKNDTVAYSRTCSRKILCNTNEILKYRVVLLGWGELRHQKYDISRSVLPLLSKHASCLLCIIVHVIPFFVSGMDAGQWLSSPTRVGSATRSRTAPVDLACLWLMTLMMDEYDCDMVRALKAGNDIKIGNWSVFELFGWRSVFEIIMGWEGRDPFPSDAITTLGNNQAASLLLLSFAKVSNTKDLVNRQTCQGVLCVST